MRTIFLLLPFVRSSCGPGSEAYHRFQSHHKSIKIPEKASKQIDLKLIVFQHFVLKSVEWKHSFKTCNCPHYKTIFYKTYKNGLPCSEFTLYAGLR
jgi:hypothetical protein